MENKNHIWQFSRIGGVSRVNLNSGSDLLALEYLDKKLWTALSCPVHGLEIDSKTLEYIDLDKDNRLRVPEVLEAVKWIISVIKNPDDLINRHQNLPLTAINEDTPEGKILISSALQILKNLGKPDAAFISVEDTSDTIKIFTGTRFNGDGIVTEDSTDDESVKKLINDIILYIGSAADRSGKDGVTAELVNDYYQNCEAYLAWQTKAENNAKTIMPFGDSTAEAFEVINTLKLKVEDYFVRCRLVAYDPHSADVLNNMASRFEAISTRELTENMSEIASFPMAYIEAGKPLPLKVGINPAWEKMLTKFKNLVVDTSFKNKESITEEEWKLLLAKFDDYSTWMADKSGALVENAGLTNIKEVLNANLKEELLLLIEKDKALESEANNIFLVDKLVRYYRDIYTLLNNFVTFHDFFSDDSKAVFQAGRLYLDQRACDLCIKVNDMPKHAGMAGFSGICLIYCDCYSKIKNERMTIVAALTDGDFDDIVVGRNAVFFDNNGLDWDATIVKIIENPISIRQAFWSPYRKFARFINKQIEKFAADKEKAVDTQVTAGIQKTTDKADAGLTKAVTSAAPAATPPATPPPPPPPFDIGKFVGIFAAIGLALGAIGSVLAAVFSGFLSLVWWKMPIALLGVILAISGPSMILAWLKLRKRNLAPVLDANGWAVNAKVTVNIAFGNTLTHLASLPLNSKLNLIDPFKKKKNPLWYIIIVALLVFSASLYLLWHFGLLKSLGI